MMRVQIMARGRLFDADPPLDSVIDLLKSYQVGFGECIKIASGSHGVQAKSLHPRIQLQSVTRSSLDVWTILGAASSIQALALPILRDAWTLYKEAKEVIPILSWFFERNDRAMQMVVNHHTHVEPGASNYTVHNGVMHITLGLQKAAKKVRPEMEKLAGLISNNQAERLIFTPEPSGMEGFFLDEDNQSGFKDRSRTVESEEPSEMDANIIMLHKQTMNGKVEIFDVEEGRPRVIPFSIREGEADEYIQAMRAPACQISAHKEFCENALGETSILRLYLIAAKPVFQ